MYQKFFGLRADPFSVSPDPRYLFMTRHADEALACLMYGVESRKGFVLLTGEVGTGKTTLINKLMELLRPQQVATAFLFNPNLTVPQFLDYMMMDFGIPCESKSKSQLLIRFYEWLLARHRAGGNAVLIVDEAQDLSVELLEEIRLFSNVETSAEKLLQIVLSGQPELDEKIRQPQLRQLRQRIAVRARTYPLSLEETKIYVGQRLQVAGSNGERIFDNESLEAICRYSNGIPRMVNLICENCLVCAFVDRQKKVNVKMVDAVARDLYLDDANSSPLIPPPASMAPDSKPDTIELLKTSTHPTDRSRESESEPPQKEKS